MRAAYLGPAGTNSHEALLAAGREAEPWRSPTVDAVVGASQEGEAERGLVPIENSLEGAVGATLDALVFDAPDVVIVGEVVHGVRYCLARREPIEPDEVRTVHSHPQAIGQCARFLREQLPGAAIVAGAVDRRGRPGGRRRRHARRRAAAARSARPSPPSSTARSCSPRGSRTTPGTRRGSCGWRAPADAPRPRRRTEPRRQDSARVLGRRRRGARLARRLPVGVLVARVNLTRIESRPRRIGLGQLHVLLRPRGRGFEPGRSPRRSPACARQCEAVRVLGSFPRQAAEPPDATVYTPASDGHRRTPSATGVRAARRPPAARIDSRRLRPLVRWSCAGAQRDVRADQRLHGSPRDGAAAQGEGRGDRDRRARPALGARLDDQAGRDPARHLRARSRATRTSARSPAARCSRATTGSASTAARARA